MDTHAFASLAHVRILLVPVGSIPQSLFEKYAAEIRSFDSIRLGDIPADAKDEKARFMPSPLSTGHLHLSFPTHPPPLSHSPLTLFRPSHFPLAVIGIASCSQDESLASLHSQFNDSLLDAFPAGGIFPLARNCFVFETEGSATSLNTGDNMPGLVVLPSMMGNKRLYIGTLLADLCSHILGEFGVVVQVLESPLGNEHLNSTTLPVLPPLSDIPPPLNSDAKGDALPPILTHNSQPEVSKNFKISPAPSMKRNSSSGPYFRQSALSVQAPRKRMSTIGTASSHGRLYKVLGDFFLLAGRIEDSVIWYTEALQLFKNSHDPIWHASALEGIATASIIESWSAGHGLHNSTAATKEPWSDVSEKLHQATALYFKPPTVDGESIHSLLAYLYACCVLRHASLLFSVWSAKGWGPLAFTTMLQPGPKPYLPPTLSYTESDSWLNLERLSSISGISRTSISSVLASLHGPWLLHLGFRERIAILEATASIYACLGYKRKEAYILREVLGCIMDLMVCGREEDGATTSSIPTTAGLGLHNFNPTPGSGYGPTVGVRLSESSDGNVSILILLKYVCKVLGINLDAVQLAPSDTDSTVAEDMSASILKYDNEAVEEHHEPYGWPELQVGVVREAIAVAEALPDFPAVAQFALSSLRTLQSVLLPADQYHLYSTSMRAFTTARRRGDTRAIEYWSGRPVISIALSPLPLLRLPIEKSASALRAVSSDVAPLLQGATDPFLYNPRKQGIAKGKAIVVQNETLEFVVILQNPYVFDLDLQSISLSTSGVPFDSQPTRVTIPANSIHELIISGRATDIGSLVIRGCRVQAPGGTAREYILPLFTTEEEERLSRNRSSLACETGRIKYTGLDSFPWTRAIKRQSKQVDASSRSSFRFLECKVVPEQPLLRIRRTTVTHGAVMLYDGETSTIRITLENVSNLPIDFVRLAFEDSTILPAQQLLSEGTLSVFETYETEYDLIHRPVFTWDKEEARPISPGQSLTLTLTCFGKVGCTNGTVHISYSLSNGAGTEDSDVFYTRQLSYPLMVTVYNMLECSGMDILPFPSHYHLQDHESCNRRSRRKQLSVDDGTEWCLFSIDVRNMYGSPFDVTFERIQEGAPSATSGATIPPGSMSRIVIPIKKIILSDEELLKPIPTLSDRQFVVASSKLSTEETRRQRELFWYREALFNCVKGKWHETGGTRSGELSLRQQRMTLPMLETFRQGAARVQMKLCAEESENVTTSNGRYFPKPNEFVYLTTQVTNLTALSLIFTLDLDLGPLDCVIHEGVLSDLGIGRLESGESKEVVTAICFLANGRFDISAHVRAFDAPHLDGRAAKGQLTAIVEGEM
ncbi:transport protein particle complex subunit [Crucibulum laeve]|uniref:Transport protein particle complex subunit n=1 Tax=Crucibulum laeve TaxID=68775 RepID=A0A5C3MBJ0_9AGAR|nr:transport protein particle complex subunit [Crucibulum laeve]